MEPLKVAAMVQDWFPDEVKEISEFRGQVSIVIHRERVKEILKFLHDTPELSFRYLEDLCGVDHLGRREPRFGVIYQLHSPEHRHKIRIKAEVPAEPCVIESVTEIWAGANWHERECYDLFGIIFSGHPDLRRILLPDDWEGHPLRKDYPLPSDLGDREWQGYRAVIEKARQNKKFEVR